MDSFTLDVIIPLKIKIIKKPQHTFAHRPSIFKLQQEVLRLNDICVSLGSPKNWSEDGFSKLGIEVLRTSVFLNSNF